MDRPWLLDIPPSGGQAAQALFAARVEHWPFDVLVRHVWVGEDAYEVRDQLLEHQLRFIAALHPGPALDTTLELTFDLRYQNDPASGDLECALLGKAAGADRDSARAAVHAAWETAAALTPIGYRLVPAADEAGFRYLAGWDAAEAAPDHQWVEIRRTAEYVLWTDDRTPLQHLPVIYPFGWQPSGWDLVWGSLAATRRPSPAILSVSLRPTTISQADQLMVGRLAHLLGQVAEQAAAPLKAQAGHAARYYEGYLQQLRSPFSLRVGVIGSEAAARAVRGALTLPNWPVNGEVEGSALFPEVVAPVGEEAAIARRNLMRLDQSAWGPAILGGAYPQLDRLRYLADPAGALCAFRLPFAPPVSRLGFKIGREFAPAETDEA